MSEVTEQPTESQDEIPEKQADNQENQDSGDKQTTEPGDIQTTELQVTETEENKDPAKSVTATEASSTATEASGTATEAGLDETDLTEKANAEIKEFTEEQTEIQEQLIEKLEPQSAAINYITTITSAERIGGEQTSDGENGETPESSNSEESLEHKEAVPNIEDDFGKTKKPYKIKKKSVVEEKNKLIVYAKVGPSDTQLTGGEEDEYVWVEEEVDEEIEVETDEEEIGEEGEVEEEAEEELEEGSEDLEEGEDREIVEEVVEEAEAEAEEEEEYHKVLEGEVEGEVAEEFEEIAETILEEEIEGEILEAEQITEEISEEEGIEEGEFEGEEGLEEVEEEVVRVRKKRKKFKTIKVIKMVRKRKEDVLEMLRKKAEAEEESRAIQEEEEEEIDELEEMERLAENKKREKLFELMKSVANELIYYKKKNRFLSKAVIDHFSRLKKIEKVHETVPPTAETLQKYYKKLHLLKDRQQATNEEMLRMNEELDMLSDEARKITEIYQTEMAELLKWEFDIGKQVIQTQTGKPLEESVINHLVQRHETILKRLSEERLKLVTVTHDMTAKETSMKALVALEGNLSLIDYEQLRLDRHVCTEKLEERENELANIRKKVLDVIHTNAHVLEKSDAIIDDIENANGVNAKLNVEVNELREKVNKLRKTRDNLRVETIKMKKGAGLLNRPKLAIDYEESAYKIIKTRNKLECLVKTFERQKVTIDKLRKHIQDAILFKDFS